MEQVLGRSVPRRSVLAGSSAAALGVTSLALPSGQAAASFDAILAVSSETGGVVYGWGAHLGEPVFGTALSMSATTPIEITGDSFTWPEVVQVTTGRYTSFGLTAEGRVYAWGDGAGNLIGDGSTSDRPTPVLTSLASDVRIVQVSASAYALALQDSGRIWAWGAAGAASGLASNTATPTDVTSTLGHSATIGGSDRVVRALASFSRSAALTATGRVLTWGTQSGDPVLGQGQTGNVTQASATEIGGSLTGRAGTPSQIVQIALGPNAGVALGRDGSVHTWGRGASGQLGRGSTDASNIPIEITGNGELPAAGAANRIIQVAVGGNQMLALGLDGRIYGWGSTAFGSLAIGPTEAPDDPGFFFYQDALAPIEITGNGALPAPAATSSRIVQVLATESNGYALGADGRVYAWGSGSRYALGNNSTDDQSSPVEITGFGVFAELAPNTGEGAIRAPRRIVLLGGGPVGDGQHVLAIDDRGVA